MKIWKCEVCGYIHEGDEPPEKCPVCGADKSRFVEVTEKAPVASEADVEAPVLDMPSESPAKKDPLSRIYDLVSRHHLHPISVHVPNGVLPISVFFLMIAIIFPFAGIDAAVSFNIIAVLFSMPVVLFSGFVDWKKRYNGSMTTLFLGKMVCGGIVLVTALILVVWRIIHPDIVISGSAARFPFLMIHLIMLGAAGFAGFLGGKLVFKD